MGFEGLVIGIAAFIIIGMFHPIVIKCQYYFTDRIWPVFLIAGIITVALSCIIQPVIVSAVLAILGCTCFWSILELKEQTRRVKKGWFPQNPKRTVRGQNTVKEEET
ncbi:DUF4491 family protein [Anaerocolumna xylanovorans]|uniref:DUF4491 domain-containing protein n=1 Tax=Anaerocolumna xylanovorans DSM 12503 TaxID=1121345 RepID=A0A1M7XZT4_9FIRM|nr:DUF4491 family protein [Anaerocolumna xylanovorans]SHO44704.1 protein of unknown function [Anaerocolumna xylanovorans DSM 12503]